MLDCVLLIGTSIVELEAEVWNLDRLSSREVVLLLLVGIELAGTAWISLVGAELVMKRGPMGLLWFHLNHVKHDSRQPLPKLNMSISFCRNSCGT